MDYFNPYTGLPYSQMNFGQSNNPYQQPMRQQPQQVPQQQTQLVKPERHIDRVHGIEGAKQYFMNANEDVFLLDDTEGDVGYFKMTDQTGFPTVKAFKLTLIPEKSTRSLEETLTSISDRLDKLERRSSNGNNGNKYSRNAEPQESGR